MGKWMEGNKEKQARNLQIVFKGSKEGRKERIASLQPSRGTSPQLTTTINQGAINNSNTQ